MMEDTMSNSNLVILPSRSRPDNVERCINALKENSVVSDFCVAIDDDQSDLYPRLDDVIYEVNPRLRMNGTLNLVANKYADKYKTIYFLGDDHLVKTKSWDRHLAEAINIKGYGLAYGNDLLQGKNLATAVMMSTNIIQTLGFMAPPKLIHLFMDNFWMTLGLKINSLYYFDDVIIEHLHPYVGKAEMDAGYAEANSEAVGTADQKEFVRYLSEEFEDDLKKVMKLIG
jgi:hypothetical protein